MKDLEETDLYQEPEEEEYTTEFRKCCYSEHIMCDDSWLCCDCPFDMFGEEEEEEGC